MFASFGSKKFLGGPALLLSNHGERKKLPGHGFSRNRAASFECPHQVRFARFFRQFLRAQQSGKMFGNSIKRGGPLVTRTLFFRALDLFPVRPDLIDVLYFHIAEDVWMAA